LSVFIYLAGRRSKLLPKEKGWGTPGAPRGAFSKTAEPGALCPRASV